MVSMTDVIGLNLHSDLKIPFIVIEENFKKFYKHMLVATFVLIKVYLTIYVIHVS